MLGGGTNPRSERWLFPSPYDPLPFPRAAKGDTPLETPFFQREGLVFWIELSQFLRHADYFFAKLSEAQRFAGVAVFYVSKFVCV